MKRVSILLAIIAACAVCFSVAAKTKPKTVQFTIRGHVEGTVQATATGALAIECCDVGITSHAGRHYNLFTGTLLPDGTGTSAGTWTGANKDQLVWTAIINGTTLTVTVVSGTGRYLGATGGFLGEMSNLELVVDPATGAGTISYDYIGEGQMTY